MCSFLVCFCEFSRGERRKELSSAQMIEYDVREGAADRSIGCCSCSATSFVLQYANKLESGLLAHAKISSSAVMIPLIRRQTQPS